jgi:hypothetical protein
MIYSNPADIFSAKLKPKETIVVLQEALINGDITIEHLFEFYDQAKDPQKASCLSALAEIVQTNPEFVGKHVAFIATQVAHPANRVSWEASEIMARVAATFPTAAISAIPALQHNALHAGTVVKWSAAYALTEIAKANSEQQKKLKPFIEKQSELEANNGVRKIYEQYLKENS